MNILYDFTLFEIKYGCCEYARRIVLSLLGKTSGRDDVQVFALYDSTKAIAFDDLTEEKLNQTYHIGFLDCAGKSLKDIVMNNSIDKAFFPCIQLALHLEGLTELECEVVFVSHDIANEELFRDGTQLYMEYMRIVRGWNNKCRWKQWFLSHKLLGTGRRHEEWREFIKPAIELYNNNSKNRIVTVSNYSKNSLMYYYSIKPEDISVLYSPQRCFHVQESVTDDCLLNLINSGKKYYLLVSANRVEKNPYRVFYAFQRFSAANSESYLVTVGYKGAPLFDNHIPLPYLSDGDLSKAYAHCYALLFPSYFEGFGYPPLEAMRYGKPVLASYSTSIPEILGDSAIYFCPFYESAIFDALNKLNGDNYAEYSKKATKRYEIISRRQEEDLDSLIELLL